MTQKEKDLLLKDLCARLPYGVWIERKLKSCKFGAKCMVKAHDINAIERGRCDFYKPYLFPLSSMTEEQYDEMEDIIHTICHSGYAHHFAHQLTDWYNKNHFDYRGLIKDGLAIDATGKNIY